MKTEAIVAGHGGQGVLELANWLAYYYLERGHHVAYTPSYGPETRGGKVKCYVVASDEPIDSPVVEAPDLLVVMNVPSMDFVPLLRPGGTLVINTSLVAGTDLRRDVTVVPVPATELAAGLGRFAPEPGRDTSLAANAVMLGAILARAGGAWEAERTTVESVFRHFLTDRKVVFVPLDLAATELGFRSVARPLPAPA
ncbi:MAG TPA: 2-oxoacid:acceptor oxidoreductase family protein [Thermoplasmata archaeon]|nr:2-oxoacid:acceptor oxidoreductase family protein [Thermoplasmata archaeon]